MNHSSNSDEQPKGLPCAEKLAFDTQKDAKATAVVAKHQHGTNLITYKCLYCNLWHLASK